MDYMWTVSLDGLTMLVVSANKLIRLVVMKDKDLPLAFGPSQYTINTHYSHTTQHTTHSK